LIVIAEDEYLLADILEMLLVDAGHEVVSAPHGVAALELVRGRQPALLITDFMMPMMTGLELAEAIRKDVALDALPIILVSGAQGAIGRSHPEMFDAVLDKPYDIDEMLNTVERLLSRR
jgi:CheY-like chemotaxis protein